MLELDEPVEQGAIVRVIGVGTFGLRVAGSMTGCIHKVECFGVVQKDSAGPDNLPLVSLPMISNQDHHDAAPLLEKLGTPDLVFIVANLDEEDGLLKDICTAIRGIDIPTFLVIPESACTRERNGIRSEKNEGEKVELDGVMIVSESSMEPPFLHLWEKQDASSLHDYFFQLVIRQITDLITTSRFMAIDFFDVMHKIRGGLMRFGAGMARGDGRAVKAAEKAILCLRKQGAELQNMTGALNSIYGSSDMSMDDYNLANSFLSAQFNGECNILLGVIHEDSLGDSLMVGVFAIHAPAEETVFPSWVRLYDINDHYRHSETTVRDPFTFASDIEKDEELPQ